MKPHILVSDKGRYVVRECDSDDGCMVIEQWVTPQGSGNGEPTYDIHIPGDSRVRFVRVRPDLRDKFEPIRRRQQADSSCSSA